MVAAPHSGAGKTVLTLGILAALRANNIDVRAAKSGPDYIDTSFHHYASGHPSINLDAWSMSSETLVELAHRQGGQLLVIEAAMGIIDGDSDGQGSPAQLARALKTPIIFVIDCARQAQSAILPVLGFLHHCPDLTLGGVILNKIGSVRHGENIAAYFRKEGIKILGYVRARQDLKLDSRHLGLIQAREIDDLRPKFENWAKIMDAELDLDALYDLARPLVSFPASNINTPFFELLGQHTAIADDGAFGFTYTHIINSWRRAGGEVSFFSPLANQAPAADANAVFLPGGYPELHAHRIAHATKFRKALLQFAKQGKRIYGECGGYMTLGTALIDAQGNAHEMLNLLPLVSSFERPALHLGYRYLCPREKYFRASMLLGHEFHYARVVSEGKADRLFDAEDSAHLTLGAIGLRRGNIAGSFAHIIAPAPEG